MVDSQKRIAGAFLVGAALVAGAFVLSKQTANTQTQGSVIATESPKREYVEIVDSNKDGVPDWQDALLNTEPISLLEASSTYQVPTTVTGKFAVGFFEDYVRSKTYGVFGDTQEELVTKSTQKLAEQAIDELFTEKDITIFPLNDTQTLKAYGNHIASIILAHPNNGDSEVVILQDSIRYDKPERLDDLAPIALAYTTMIKELLEAPVPEKYVHNHLNLINALNAVREDIRGMQKINTDAMYTLLRMKRYEDDVLGMSNAITNIFDTLYLQDTVRWEDAEPVMQLVTFPQ